MNSNSMHKPLLGVIQYLTWNYVTKHLPSLKMSYRRLALGNKACNTGDERECDKFKIANKRLEKAVFDTVLIMSGKLIVPLIRQPFIGIYLFIHV